MQIATRTVFLSLAVLALFAGGCQDDTEARSDRGSMDAGLGPSDMGADEVAGDHRARCAEYCVDPDPANISCTARDLAGCEGLCEEVLEGFSDECGDCVVDGIPGLVEMVDSCFWGDDRYRSRLDSCATSCSGNRGSVSPVELLSACEAFCVVSLNGGVQTCVSEVTASCQARCRDRLVDLPRSCAGCILGRSARPRTTPLSSMPCVPEYWESVDSCSDYCE